MIGNSENGNISGTQELELRWTNLAQTDFVRIVYGLHEAGIVNGGTGEITKIVPEIARRLGFSLSKNWKQLLSSSKEPTTKVTTHVAIFEQMKKGYESYLNRVED